MLLTAETLGRICTCMISVSKEAMHVMMKTHLSSRKKTFSLLALLKLLLVLAASSTSKAGTTIADAVMLNPHVRTGENIQVYLLIPAFGVCVRFVETITLIDGRIEIDIDSESSLPPGFSCVAIVEPQQHIVTLDPLPAGQYSLAVSFRGQPQVDNVLFSVSGDTPNQTLISPPSGTYAESQNFDMAVLIEDVNISDFIVGEILIDGRRLNRQDAECFISGELGNSGVSFRCPNLSAASLGVGVHHVSVVLSFANIKSQQVSASVVWEVVSNTEN